MTGIHAQLVALTSYGNAFLQAGENIDTFYPGNSSFQFCNSVDFKSFEKSVFSQTPKEKPYASDPVEWLKFLKKDGARKLRLFYHAGEKSGVAEEHKLAGMVGGGGTWMIEAIYRKHSHYWFNRWQVTAQDDPARRIWSVSYGMFDQAQPTTDTYFDVAETRGLVERSLDAIVGFAQAQQLADWAEVFRKAKARLDDADPGSNYYHADILAADHYPLQARQLLFAAGSAWVFGGMGSWNDLGFSRDADIKTYNEVSADLYNAITQAILAVANAY